MPREFVDGHSPQGWDDVLLEHPPDLRQRALSSFFQGQRSVGQPPFVHRDEGVFTCQPSGLLLLLARDSRVDALGNQRSRFVPHGPGIAQAQFGVHAQRHPRLLSQPVVAEVPRLAALRRDEERQAIVVTQGVVLARCLRVADM